MAYSNLTDTEVAGGKSNKTSLWQKIKNNFANHETRIAAVESGAADSVIDLLFNIGLKVEEDTPTVNSLTITMTSGIGNDLSAADLAKINFRSATESSGVNSTVAVSASATLVIPEGATLGCEDGGNARIFIYAINNSGTVELAVSKKFFREDSLISTTALSSSSDTDTLLYSETARTDVPIRLLGFFETTEATAGNWTTAVSKVYCGKAERNKFLQTSATITENLSNFVETDLTNAEVTITTDGGPVLIGLTPDNAGDSKLIIGKSTSNPTEVVYFYLYRDTVLIAKWYQSVYCNISASSVYIGHPSSSIQYIDLPDVGTHTYKLAASGNGGLTIQNTKMVAYEMK